mgnify:CR=1 FL=1
MDVVCADFAKKRLNERLDEVQAAILRVKLPDLAENLAQARKLLGKGSLVLGRPGTRATPGGVPEAGGSSSGRRTALGLVLLLSGRTGVVTTLLAAGVVGAAIGLAGGPLPG